MGKKNYTRIGTGRYKVKGEHLIDLKSKNPDRYIPFIKRRPLDMSDLDVKYYNKVKSEYKQWKKP